MAKPMPLPTPAAAAVAPARFPVGLLLHTTPPLRLRSLLTPPPQSRCLSSPLLAAAAATAGRRAARPPNPGQVISEGRDEDARRAVCPRHVKNDRADNLIPDFDFDRFISSRLMKRSAGTPVIVMVVDCADFDGSFPKRAAKSLFRALEGGELKLSETPRLVLIGTKVDLLPWEQMGVRLEKWVRGRAKALGAKLDAVYLVSVHKDLSVRNLISYVKALAGPRSNVWVIGAQNAGKSTLINAFAKKQGVNITRLTEAAVPGTTLGILRMTATSCAGRAAELGQWTERRIDVSGLSWDVSSTDIAVSGLGWYSLGLKGKATVAVHTFDGIGVARRRDDPPRAKFLERPGFLLPIAIASAIGEETRKKNAKLIAQQEATMAAMKTFPTAAPGDCEVTVAKTFYENC
ncbi:hypothetical protein ZWY2020_051735 [Hordeum vulgare]|nr:hypothetical protein ZWY2020_051735 [Hordeum vulgare]